MSRLVTVLVTLAVPQEADADDAAALLADAAVSTALVLRQRKGPFSAHSPGCSRTPGWDGL